MFRPSLSRSAVLISLGLGFQILTGFHSFCENFVQKWWMRWRKWRSWMWIWLWKSGICFRLGTRTWSEREGLPGGSYRRSSRRRRWEGMSRTQSGSRSIGRRWNLSCRVFVAILWLWLMSIWFRLLRLVNPLFFTIKCKEYVWVWCILFHLSALIFVVISGFGCFRKGDYYRYLAEFKTGNERKEAADQSLKAYQVYMLLFHLSSWCSFMNFVHFCLLRMWEVSSMLRMIWVRLLLWQIVVMNCVAWYSWIFLLDSELILFLHRCN